MDIGKLEKANTNRARREQVEAALSFWERVGNQDNPNFRLELSHPPGNRQHAPALFTDAEMVPIRASHPPGNRQHTPTAALFTEAEMVPIRAAKIHSLRAEIEKLDQEFAAL